jgi:hypothetical protein
VSSLPDDSKRRFTRDAAGAVERLHWATYVFTRAPLGFGEHLG